ncbi:MAG: ROK family protein [Chthonomonadaceae bacterium]|nr:ROK family protein [Chthonomonadaceae bacterium]
MSESLVLGIDLGGTNARAAAVNFSTGIEGERFEVPSNAQKGTQAILEALTSVVTKVRSQSCLHVSKIGLSVPGHVDNRNGLVRWAPNFGETRDGVFHYWKDVPLRDELSFRTGLDVVMGNDANCAALGEYIFGAGRSNASCLVLLTVGTGIGGGVVLSPGSVEGEARGPLLLVGGNRGGAELGHITVSRGGLDCNAGSYGALEAYCQRDAIVRRAQHQLRRGTKSLVLDLVGADLSKVTPLILTEAADLGDALAIDVWREIGTYLGTGIGSLINVFSPDLFAIGGQIAKAGKWLVAPAIEEAQRIAIPTLFADCRICLAEVLDDAGLLGAAALARQTT